MTNSNKNQLEDFLQIQKKIGFPDLILSKEFFKKQMSIFKNEPKSDGKKELTKKKKTFDSSELKEDDDEESNSKEDNEILDKKDFIKIEDDGVVGQGKKKRGRPKKDGSHQSIKKDKPQNKEKLLKLTQNYKKIKVEGTVKLDLTLFLE